VIAADNEVNGAPLDRFTVGHAAVGVAYGAAGLSLLWTIALALAWELAERPMKAARPEWFPHPSDDTAQNAVVDVGAVIVGWLAVRGLR
jgi:hypothetical protein